MEFSKLDQIEFVGNKVIHKSAGGFVFYESPDDHILYVALLQKQDGRFFIPKGHLLKNEKPENAAIREVEEELLLKDNLKIIAKLGVDSYIFNLPNDNRLHYKDVHLYIFVLEKKFIIKPLKNEDFVNAEWLKFNDALEKIAFDKNNLLKARQYFYFNKSVRLFDNLNDIKSISVGIPSCNGSKTIYQALQSVIESLSFLPKSIFKEIIICFDHCTDNTYNIVKDFISKEDSKNIKIKLIYNNGVKGKSTALNKIFSNSLLDILCFVDDDVILDDKCILNLISAFILEKGLRCAYAKWKRKLLISNNPWRKFWHWILGVKFEIQPYDKPSEIMRASCIMFRRENFVYLPDDIKNDDQFLQYIYWPNTQEIQDAILYFNSVSSVFDYYKRFIRIMYGSKQLKREFTKERIDDCNKDLYRRLDYKKILQLPLYQKLPFLFYRFIRFFINLIVKIKLNFNNNYEWFRIRQG